MRKLIFVLLLIVAVLIVGCAESTGMTVKANDDFLATDLDLELSIADYFPYLHNTRLEYEGIGNEFAGKSVYFEYIDGNRAQIKEKNPGTNMVRIIEYKDGAITEIYSEGEFYHIENFLNNKANSQEILLKEPLEVGTNWLSSNGYKKEITSIDRQIETPYGVLQALEVTTEYDNGRLEKTYYSQGIGFVASIYIDGDFRVETLLKDKSYGPIEEEILLFYPLYNGEGTRFINDRISFKTNDKVEKLLEEKFKFPPKEDLLPTIALDTVINRIYLDKNTWIANVDFSKELLTDINAGSSYEYEILRSIVNTIGKFYDADKVYITVDKKPYESGHFALLEGEAFKISTDNIKEYK